MLARSWWFMEFSYKKGIHCPASDLWLDPVSSRAEAVVSHAHSDHVRRHVRTHATPATAELIRLRYGYTQPAECHEFGKPFRMGAARVTLYPAGHVLGSAQVLVEEGGCRLLYSGDLRLRHSIAADETVVPRADVVVVDATFGERRYCFPDEEAVVAQIVRFCQEGFERDEVPVLYAYSLGKAQEVALHLSRNGIPTVLHPAALKLFGAYRQHGVPLPESEPLNGRPPAGTAVIFPPHLRDSPALRAVGRRRTALLSGWALDRGARYRYRCDAAFPLSDHCGYDDLLRYVELTGADEVHTVFGFARDFAAALQQRGMRSLALGQATQLALPGLG